MSRQETMPDTHRQASVIARAAALVYGLAAYLVFFGTFLYAIGFVTGVAVPKTIDTGPAGSLGESIVIDLLLMSLFAIQHSVMARPAFKRWWTRFVPVAVERSTFVLFASLTLILLLWQWRPIFHSCSRASRRSGRRTRCRPPRHPRRILSRSFRSRT